MYLMKLISYMKICVSNNVGLKNKEWGFFCESNKLKMIKSTKDLNNDIGWKLFIYVTL